MAGVTLKIKGLNKIKNLEKKVFVSNHVGYFDAIVLYYILGCGFLSSNGIKEDPFFSNIENIIPVLLVRRGTNQNTVNRMKQFVSDYGSICLFPEGMFSYPGTIARFRSGAFKINEPIYPIVLKYNKYILDADAKTFAMKVGSNIGETIEITFLDPFYPPFDDKTPEIVRMAMAKNGLLLTRVLGNDYIDPDL
jgi:1-acyl-sn-glycerol-3-phosphate acyltransferase